MKPRHIFGMIMLALIWGSIWMMQDALHHAVPPLRFMALSFLIGAALLLPFLSRQHIPSGTGLRASLILSATMMALPTLLVFEAARYIAFSDYMLVSAALPLLLALMSRWMNPEHSVPRSAAQVMILGLGGVMLMLPSGISLVFTWSRCLGVCSVVLAIVMQAGSYLYAKRTLRDVQPAATASIQLFFAGIILGLCSFALERGQTTAWNTPAQLALILSGLLGSAAAYWQLYALLQSLEAYQVSSIYMLVPIVSIAEGAILLRAPLTWNLLVGAIAIVASVIFLLRVRTEEQEIIELRLSD